MSAVLFTIMMFAPAAFAYVYSGDVHTSTYVYSTSDIYWSNIAVSSGETLNFKVSVSSGSTIHVYLIDNSELYTALSGGAVIMHTKDEYTRSVDRTYSTSGNFALVIESTGTSYVKVDITKTSSSFNLFDNELVCVGVIVLGIIFLIVIVVVVARRRSSPPVQPYAQPARPPAGYPQPQQAPHYQGYQSPPAPAPSYPQPAPSYPQQQYQQPGYGVQPPAATMIACKYCGLQVPSNSTVCSRCGGRL